VHLHRLAVAKVEACELAEQLNRLNVLTIAHGPSDAVTLGICQLRQRERSTTSFAVNFGV
jgi:hypothetical protein